MCESFSWKRTLVAFNIAFKIQLSDIRCPSFWIGGCLVYFLREFNSWVMTIFPHFRENCWASTSFRQIWEWELYQGELARLKDHFDYAANRVKLEKLSYQKLFKEFMFNLLTWKIVREWNILLKSILPICSFLFQALAGKNRNISYQKSF